MKIAHFSDLHLLSLAGVPAHRFFNKRLTGWANLRLKRGAIHRAAYVRAIAREVSRGGFDHVVITGDLTNLALESEFQLTCEVLEEELAMDPGAISVLPGNHDLYTQGALRSRRFERFLGGWLVSDLPELAVDVGGARFPVVKLRGPAAVIAMSSAVPQPPFVAAGELGSRQIDALARILEHPEVLSRTAVVALHHPLVHGWSRLKQRLEGVRDGYALLALLRTLPRGLVLHGHLHRRVQRTITTARGALHHIGATSASLQHEAPDRMAGYNVYEVDELGVTRIEARVYEPTRDAFRNDDVPKSP
jgi:3',5'-cyclic AMP phosphodiesterase CpdA